MTDREDAISAALQQNHAIPRQVLTGWVLVSEWMDETGERWLMQDHSTEMTSWAARGLYHEVLYGKWPE